MEEAVWNRIWARGQARSRRYDKARMTFFLGQNENATEELLPECDAGRQNPEAGMSSWTNGTGVPCGIHVTRCPDSL